MDVNYNRPRFNFTHSFLMERFESLLKNFF